MARPAQSNRRNASVALLLCGVVAGMVGLSFAAVPLYRLFCQVTGYAGTPQIAASAPESAAERLVKIRFNADVNPALPWRFGPEQREVTVKVGEQTLIFYKARNLSDRPLTGTATFNVTPLKAGSYFTKVECFCFTEQHLEPGEEAEMAVSFFVDPEISDDPNLDEVKTITLSYTLFRAEEEEEQAEPLPHAALSTGTAGEAKIN